MVLRDGIATAASGAFAPFRDIGSYHLLDMLKQAAVPGDHQKAVQTVLSGFDEAKCIDDVAPAFKRIHAKGIKVTCVLQQIGNLCTAQTVWFSNSHIQWQATCLHRSMYNASVSLGSADLDHDKW